MNSQSIIGILALLQISCSSGAIKPGVEYIKVITIGNADSLTLYNKGLSLQEYLYYDGRDSVVYKEYQSEHSDRSFVSFFASNNHGFKNIMEELTILLKSRPDGIVDSSFDDGSVYCGPTFYVELFDGHEIHYYTFILNGNDTLQRFSDFYYRSQVTPSKTSFIDDESFDGDSIAVNMLNGLGYYKEVPIPFLGVSCDSAIEIPKIFGVWRTISTLYETDGSSFTKLSFKKNGDLIWERFVEGLLRQTVKLKFEVSESEIIVSSSLRGKRVYVVTKLTDSCLEYEYGGEVLRYNRY